MIHSIRIHADASAELSEAVRWYESKRPGLGRDLLDEVATAIALVAENQVVFRLRATEIVIVAIAHLKRRPGYWKHRQ